MRKTKKHGIKITSLALVIALMLTMMPMAAFAAAPSDITNHWAEKVITEWLEKGMASGYPDGTFKPENSITRAEFMALANKAFGYTEAAEVDFVDVVPGAWYVGVVAKAKAAGYISGYPDGTIKPEAPITRQEVAAIMAKINNLEGNPSAINAFADAAAVPSWSQSAIGAVVTAGYMKGYPDNTFKPANNITRAEALVTLNNAIKEKAPDVIEEPVVDVVVYDEAGTYGPASGKLTIDKDVVIKADGVTLQNYTIKGSLTIAEEVGKGTVTLNNITVEGETFVRGGGTDSIIINGGSFNKITVEKTSSGAVRIVATGIQGLQVVVAEAAAGGKIVLEGTFDKVVVQASKVEIETKGNTTIKEVEVASKATDTVFKLQEGTIVTKMTVEAVVKVEGSGTIKEVAGSQAGKSTFEKEPEKVTAPSVGGGGGGGGGATVTVLTVNDINMIVDGDNAGTDLTDRNDNARVTGISFIVNAEKSKLKITKIVSDNMVASVDRTVEFNSKNATVTIEQLLGLQESVSLGTLRSAFGSTVTIEGVLSAEGYTSYGTPITITLGGSPAEDAVNNWATLAQSGNVITATIKNDAKDVNLSDIGIATFLSNTFNQLPEEVNIKGKQDMHNWIKVADYNYENYELIKKQLGELCGKTWEKVTLADLKGKTIWFKTSDYTEYTLKIV